MRSQGSHDAHVNPGGAGFGSVSRGYAKRSETVGPMNIRHDPNFMHFLWGHNEHDLERNSRTNAPLRRAARETRRRREAWVTHILSRALSATHTHNRRWVLWPSS